MRLAYYSHIVFFFTFLSSLIIIVIIIHLNLSSTYLSTCLPCPPPSLMLLTFSLLTSYHVGK